MTAVNPFPGIIHVSPNPGEGYYTSLKDAVTAEGDNKVYILHPGTYVEDNPVTIPNSSTVRGEGSPLSVVIFPMNPASTLIEMGQGSTLEHLTLVGSVTDGVIAAGDAVHFDASTSGTLCQVEKCVIKNFNGACVATGNNTAFCGTMLINQGMILADTGNLTHGICGEAGAQVIARSCVINGHPISGYTINHALHALDLYTKFTAVQHSISYCTTAAAVDNNGELEVNLLTVSGADKALIVGATGTESKIRAGQFNMKNSTTYDLDIQATDAQIVLIGSEMDESKINNPNNVTINAQFSNRKNERNHQAIIGDVRIGTVTVPSRCALGQGRYDVSSLIAFQNTNGEVGTWTDITTEAKSLGGSTFGMFAGTTIGQCTYIGNTYASNILGIEVSVTTAYAGAVLGDIVPEYWDGGAWQTLPIMVTNSVAPYYNSSTSLASAVGVYNVRFGITSGTSIPTKILNGVEAEWFRIRLSVGTWPSLPLLEYIKLHTSTSEFNTDGVLEFYGDARSIGQLPWSLNLTDKVDSTPASQDIFLGKSIGVGRSFNEFQSIQTDRIGLCEFLPPDIDTSFPLKIKFACLGSSAVSGDVDFNVRWGITNAASAVYTTTAAAPVTSVGERSTTSSITITNNTSEFRGEISIDIQGVIPVSSTGQPDLLWVTIERDGTADTYGGDVAIEQMGVFYVRWRSGGHILSY